MSFNYSNDVNKVILKQQGFVYDPCQGCYRKGFISFSEREIERIDLRDNQYQEIFNQFRNRKIMLFITEIKVKDYHEQIMPLLHKLPMLDAMSGFDKEVTTIRETITGEWFVNDIGESVCIGMSEQVQEAIGLPMKVFSKLGKEIEEQNNYIINLNKKNYSLEVKINRLKKKVNNYKKRTFRQRLTDLLNYCMNH